MSTPAAGPIDHSDAGKRNAPNHAAEVAAVHEPVPAPIVPIDRPVHCGFIFNHDQLHQIAHSVPIALELMRSNRAVQVSILATTKPQYDYLHRLLERHGFPAENLSLLRLPSVLRGLAVILDPLVPFSRVVTLLANRTRFGKLDVLVTPEKTSLLLQSIGTLKHLKFVHTRHGAGDRGVGFDRQSGKFDLVLMSGEKIRDRLREAGALKDDGYAIVGYPKFDLCKTADRPPLFDNDLPTVLYNPHCSPRLSSWYRHGLDVLEAFHRSDRYNLIFAPHVMLFRKKLQISLNPLRFNFPGEVPDRFYKNPRIRIDLGSPRSTDMTYTESADLYLGDVSSQVYEFLRRPRPCLFIDAHDSNWRDDCNYRHWNNGHVVGDAKDLISAVDCAFATHTEYLEVQRRLFAYSIDVRETPSALRASQAIVRFVEQKYWGPGRQSTLSHLERAHSGQTGSTHFAAQRPA